MSHAQRRRQAACATACLLCLVVFAGLALGFFRNPGAFERDALLVTFWWLSAIAALLLAVATCRSGDKPAEDPQYLHSLVQGIRDEWRRT